MLIAGVDPEGWAQQNRLARHNVLVAWGLHPWAVADKPQECNHRLHLLESLLNNPPVGVSALGETGLDHGQRIDPSTFALQAEAFRIQIRLARQHNLPLVLHIVSAHQDALKILRSETLPDNPGMVHAFNGNAELASQYLKLGLHISFCGTVVDPKRRKIRKAAATIPEERLLVETDSPDQTPITRLPVPNEPAFLIDVISAIADIRRDPATHVAKTTSRNAARLFCQHAHE